MVSGVLVGINIVTALIIAAVQECHAYWPHDSIGYLLSGLSVLERDIPLILSRANLWSLLAGPLAGLHPFLVRVLGLFLFFCSAYVLYCLIRRTDENLARIFLVLVTVPGYVVWISAAGLSEPLAYLFYAVSFTFWVMYIESEREKYAMLSALFAALLFVVRPPLVVAWVAPGIYVLVRDRNLFGKILFVFTITLLMYGVVSFVAFGAFLPTVQHMIRATSSSGFNASLLWYMLCGLYPFLVFGTLFAPMLFVAYVFYARDRLLRWFLASLVPYALIMLLFAPKEPRYYTIFVYPSAYVLARTILDRIKRLPLLLYLALVLSSFLFVPGVCVEVEYVPVRVWKLRVPCFSSPFVADAQVKLEFAKYVCAHPPEIGEKWMPIVYFMKRFYPSVCVG